MAEAIPYHALFCEVLSSLLGVRCFVRLAISAMLSGEFDRLVKELILDALEDDFLN